MASITIHKLDDALRARLQVQAAAHGRSMEDEACTILRLALEPDPTRRGGLAASIRARFAAVGGVDLPVAAREAIREPPGFDHLVADE